MPEFYILIFQGVISRLFIDRFLEMRPDLIPCEKNLVINLNKTTNIFIFRLCFNRDASFYIPKW